MNSCKYQTKWLMMICIAHKVTEKWTTLWSIKHVPFFAKFGNKVNKLLSGRESWIGSCFPSVVVCARILRLTSFWFSANYDITRR